MAPKGMYKHPDKKKTPKKQSVFVSPKVTAFELDSKHKMRAFLRGKR